MRQLVWAGRSTVGSLVTLASETTSAVHWPGALRWHLNMRIG